MNGGEYERIVNRYKNIKALLIDYVFKRSVSKSDVNIVFKIVNFMCFNNLP